ncbi:hypothetical protein JM18_001605 [Phytophthora kernoviae]|uniref:HTH myb-type domain-containing protein n=2 Tax=Phytophthora kernoviae TaxID=325452 RepID=A0A8T0M8F6_9STRA|nr:hypothetical protein G195_001804 [Phytophthora kernoviae 00238/432]KAG2531066.1 hypothetical protein JM16_001375 [Phytophthora kernoviae]KAG2531605.1 hypothetical protein JM18_001605 [Phytophthora kernoviae]
MGQSMGRSMGAVRRFYGFKRGPVRRPHPKLLSLQHVEDVFCSGGDAPMTPLGNDTPLFSATVSPRDPSTKLAAAVSKPQPSVHQSSPFANHRVCIASSDDASDEEEDDDVDDVGHPSKPVKANTGRWTEAEHKLFLQGLETFPYRAWKKIATLIKTRTVVQIRTHAQKYYQKLEKEEARMKDREAQDRAAMNSGVLSSPCTPTSPKKKMHLMRKRKCSTMLDLDTDTESDSAVLPSLPKRLAREQPLAAHMSPKQKTVTASGNKMFFTNQLSDARFMFARPVKNHAGMQPPHQLPLDFADAAAEAMILDFAEDKALADCTFDCVDQTLASIDNDDLLNLSEEELEWFSSSTDNVDSDINTAATDRVEPEPFLELDSSSLHGQNFATGLSLDDEDFVLDPEKFLSSYFGPSDKA